MISTGEPAAEAAAHALLDHGYAIVKLPLELLAISDQAILDGLPFFQADMEFKLHFGTPNLQEGYLGFGAERDKITGRPDLSESFKAWFKNIGNAEIDRWACDMVFHRTMRSALVPHAEFVEAVLAALRATFDGGGDPGVALGFNLRRESYMQMNFSQPARESRDTITDAHEDGHFLTLVRPNQRGFKGCPGSLVEPPTAYNPSGSFEPDGDLQPIETAADEAVLVPGTPTFYLTGGRVKPLFHAVATSDAHARQSLMLFANPARGDEILPWVVNSTNRNVSLRRILDAISYSHLDRHNWVDVTQG
jgi:hypothetical protein